MYSAVKLAPFKFSHVLEIGSAISVRQNDGSRASVVAVIHAPTNSALDKLRSDLIAVRISETPKQISGLHSPTSNRGGFKVSVGVRSPPPPEAIEQKSAIPKIPH